MDGGAGDVEAGVCLRPHAHLLGARGVVEDHEVVVARPQHPLVVVAVVVPIGLRLVPAAVVQRAEDEGRHGPVGVGQQHLGADVGQHHQPPVHPAHGGDHPAPGALDAIVHREGDQHPVHAVRVAVVPHDPHHAAVDHGGLRQLMRTSGACRRTWLPATAPTTLPLFITMLEPASMLTESEAERLKVSVVTAMPSLASIWMSPPQ